MEKRQKELLDWLDGEIKHHEKRLESSINMGWDDKASISMALLRKFRPLRRLAEKFYGEWREKADLILTLKDTTFLDGFIKSCNLMRDIRDFDPMLAEDKEKTKAGVR